MRARVLALLGLVVTASCVTVRAPVIWLDRPAPLVRIHPNFRAQWRAVELCSGKRGSYRAVQWYVVANGRDNFTIPGQSHPALAAAWSRVPAVVFAAPWLTHDGIVTHEIGHLLVSPRWHDPDFYQRGPCARLMYCEGECLSDTIPPRTPPATTRLGARKHP